MPKKTYSNKEIKRLVKELYLIVPLKKQADFFGCTKALLQSTLNLNEIKTTVDLSKIEKLKIGWLMNYLNRNLGFGVREIAILLDVSKSEVFLFTKRTKERCSRQLRRELLIKYEEMAGYIHSPVKGEETEFKIVFND